MQRYEALEEGMEIEVLNENKQMESVRLGSVEADIVFRDDLETSDRSYLAIAEDGRYVLYQDYPKGEDHPEGESEGLVFRDKYRLAEFLWDRHEAMDVVLLEGLDMLQLTPPARNLS